MSLEFGEKVTKYPCHNEPGACFFDSGLDSNVYLIGKYVVKDYKANLSSDRCMSIVAKTLSFYRDLTNQAARLCQGKSMFLTLDNGKRLALSVNPILHLHQCGECNHYEGISLYIEGVRGDKVGRTLNNRPDTQISRTALCQLNTDIETATGYQGVNILPLNIKILNNAAVITDLCADLKMLHRS